MSGTVAVSILIPAWDEEAGIGAVVADALAACATAGLDAECLVCVDARTVDATAAAARTAGARILRQEGRGLTAAVLQAAEAAGGRVCVVLDGDGQHDASAVVRLAGPVVAGEVDVMTGARDPDSLRGGFGDDRQGALRHGGARLLGWLARLVLRRDVPDPLTGMFACRRADLLMLRGRAGLAPPGGYKVLLGLLVLAPVGRVGHQPVDFGPRRGGGSKLGARVVATTLAQLLGVLWYHRSARARAGIGRHDLVTAPLRSKLPLVRQDPDRFARRVRGEGEGPC